MVRIVSWNVNGIRTLQPSLKASLDALDADIICLQETKISASDPTLERYALVPGYHSFFSFCTARAGYSGTATFTRTGGARPGPAVTPVAAGEGFDNDVGGCGVDWADHFDTADDAAGGLTEEAIALISAEGRVVITDHARFVIVNIYAPAVSVEGRAGFKAAFNTALEAKVRALRSGGRNVVVAGDFNIQPAVCDGAEAVGDVEAFYARSSRAWLWGRMLGELQLVDSFRAMHPEAAAAYTCWSEARRARENNHGARIDLIVVNRELYDGDVSSAAILSHVVGSDHCPISLDFDKGEWASSARKGGDVVVPPPFCTKFLKRFATKQKSILSFLHDPSASVQPPALLVQTSEASWSPPPVPHSPRAGEKQAPRSLDAPSSVPARKRARTGGGQSRIDSFFQSGTASRPVSSPTSLAAPTARLPSDADAPGNSTPKNVDSRGMKGGAESQAGSSRCSEPKASLDDAAPTRGEEQARLSSSEAKQQWRRLLPGPPPPPLCRHREPCTLKSVKKSGENRGRTFYSCIRPSGSWPSDPSACCNYFSWAPYQAGKLLPKR